MEKYVKAFMNAIATAKKLLAFTSDRVTYAPGQIIVRQGEVGDAAYVSDIVGGIDGPVVLVGHSYGGQVITAAANGHANVKSLVYVAAFAPDDGPDLELPAPDEPLSVDRLEWEHIQRVLSENDGNISATARALKMHRRTLQRKLAKRPAKE